MKLYKIGMGMMVTMAIFASCKDIRNKVSEVVDAVEVDPHQQHLDSIKTAQLAEFHQKMDDNAARLYMPGGDSTYLDRFYASLLGADSTSVRVMYYGDSQMEGDRFTCHLREYLQTTFGGEGPSMLPAVMEFGGYTCSSTRTPSSLRFYKGYGQASWRADHHRYGPMDQMSRVEGSATITYMCTGDSTYAHSGKFSKITVVGQGQGSITASTADTTVTLTPVGEGVQFYSATLKEATSRVTISINGTMDVYGVQLDGRTGVAVDNVAERGSSGVTFSSIDSVTIAPYYKLSNTSLIVYQFGANVIPGIGSEKQIEAYVGQVKRELKFLKRMAPKARILVVSPADMSVRNKASIESCANIDKLVSALRQTAGEEKCAFWDMYAAMGGNGSMARWAKETPSLASPDRIHFSHKGADKVARMLVDVIDAYYKYYRLRTFGGEE